MFDFRTFVRDIVVANDYRRLAEIGVWKGELSRILWSLPSIEYFLMVDPFDASSTGMTEKKSQWELDAIRTQLMAEKPDFVRLVTLPSYGTSQLVSDQSLDFVFIDALHTYESCRQDIKMWLPKIRNGGMIAGDDYTSRFPGVVRAVRETLPEHGHFSRVWLYKVSR